MMSFVCSICDPMGDDDDHSTDSRSGQTQGALALKCGHVYHVECIQTWNQKQQGMNMPSLCPICRANTDLTNAIRLFANGSGPAFLNQQRDEMKRVKKDLDTSLKEGTELKGMLQMMYSRLEQHLEASRTEVHGIKTQLGIIQNLLKQEKENARILQDSKEMLSTKVAHINAKMERMTHELEDTKLRLSQNVTYQRCLKTRFDVVSEQENDYKKLYTQKDAQLQFSVSEQNKLKAQYDHCVANLHKEQGTVKQLVQEVNLYRNLFGALHPSQIQTQTGQSSMHYPATNSSYFARHRRYSPY